LVRFQFHSLYVSRSVALFAKSPKSTKNYNPKKTGIEKTFSINNFARKF